MKTAPLFSVVVTTHRRPELLERALRSLLAQTFSDVEIVLVSDEGSAPTRAAANRLLREDDVFLSLPGARGPAESRNAGVYLARGRYILFLDDDDSFEATYLQRIVECERFVSDAVNYVNYTQLREVRTPDGARTVGSQVMEIGGTEIAELLCSNFIPNNAIVLSAAIAKRHQVDANLRSHEDWDYLVSLVLKHDFNFLGITGPVVHINEGDSRNNTAKSDGSLALDFLSIYRKWPVEQAQLRARRHELLKGFGLNLPPELL